MSTLSLRKIKHDSSAVDNITLDSNGNLTAAGTIAQSKAMTTQYDGIGVRMGSSTANTNRGATFLQHTYVDAGGNQGNYVYNHSLRQNDGTYIANVYTADYSAGVHSWYHPNGGLSGNPVMQIDASGRVTMPYQPSFEVGGAGGLTFTSVGANEYKLTYASIYHNIGNYYSTSTGHFTAPVTGSYLFQAVMMGVNTTSPHITFSINGSAQGGGGNYPNNNLYEHGSYSQNAYWIRTVHIFRLQANDYVRVQSYAYNSVGSPDRCYFGGHLLG